MDPEAELEDAGTYFKMTAPVSELQYLSMEGQDTPVSGDALAVYAGMERM